MNVSSQVNEFVERFADDPRAEGIKALQEAIAIRKLQRNLETRAWRRKETGKLSAIEFHCLEAIRLYRDGKLEEGIEVLDGIQLMFGDPSRKLDIGIQQTLGVVQRLQKQWTQELTDGTEDLLENLAVYAANARELAAEHPARALAIWKGMLELYENKLWAEEFTSEAKVAVVRLQNRVNANQLSQVQNSNLDAAPDHATTGEVSNAN